MRVSVSFLLMQKKTPTQKIVISRKRRILVMGNWTPFAMMGVFVGYRPQLYRQKVRTSITSKFNVPSLNIVKWPLVRSLRVKVKKATKKGRE